MSKTWLITGAGRGLGYEIARAALEAGDNVVAAGRNASDVEKAFASEAVEEQLLAVALDVTRPDQIAAAVKVAIDRFGRIDILVNNAGYGQIGFFETLTPEQLERQYATNLFGLFNVTRAVLPHMRRERSGHIVNIASIGGSLGFGGACAYTSSKFAVEGFSEDMAIDLKPFGIHVTVVEPGFFRTDFLDSSSVKYGDIEIDDYAERDAAQRAHYGEHSHQQLGDPRKLGRALVKISAEAEPPLRLTLGSDAVQMTRNMLARRLTELDRWESLSVTTDHAEASLSA